MKDMTFHNIFTAYDILLEDYGAAKARDFTYADSLPERIQGLREQIINDRNHFTPEELSDSEMLDRNLAAMWDVVTRRLAEKERLFTQRDMQDLLRSYDALRDLRKFLGVDGIAFGFGSVLERLYVSDVITRHSVLSEEEIGAVLDDRESDYSERARKLLQNSP